jgi:hypothetical protein
VGNTFDAFTSLTHNDRWQMGEGETSELEGAVQFVRAFRCMESTA